MVKNPPAMRKTWVRSLGWEDPLEKAMATHSSILACKELDTTEQLSLSLANSKKMKENVFRKDVNVRQGLEDTHFREVFRGLPSPREKRFLKI